MTAADVAVRELPTAIPAKIQYAKALADSGLLPAQYRKNPANVLWASEYGDMLGLSTMAAITGVHVIDGKPTASAGLISALVRRAGHKLHIRGNNKSATCKIIRSDDPEPFVVTWTLRKNSDDNPSAEEAKLLGKDVWQKYPASMLKARAITQCARDACEEALFGLHYTAEELGADVDEDGVVVDHAPPTRIEYGPGGTLVVDPECLVDPEPTWTDQAIELASSLKSEAGAGKLWRETAAKLRSAEITDEDAGRIGDLIQARVADLRHQAYAQAMSLLSENDPWRDKIESLADEDEARAALEELAQLMTARTVDQKTGNRRSAAIVAKFPRATDTDREAVA